MRESKRLFVGVNRLEKTMTLRLIQSYPSLREAGVRILGRIHVNNAQPFPHINSCVVH